MKNEIADRTTTAPIPIAIAFVPLRPLAAELDPEDPTDTVGGAAVAVGVADGDAGTPALKGFGAPAAPGVSD